MRCNLTERLLGDIYVRVAWTCGHTAGHAFHWLLRVRPGAGVCVRRLRVCDHANAHGGHRVGGAWVLGRDDAASIHGGLEWGLAEALADQLGLDLTVGEVPVTDIVAGWLHSADIALAQVSATKESHVSDSADSGRPGGPVRPGPVRPGRVDRRFPMTIRPLKRVPFRQGSCVDQQVAPERSMDPRPVVEALPVEQSIIDNALYTDGHRTDSPATLAETFRLLRTRPDSMAWIGLYRPAESQILAVAEEFGLHELAVEDAIVAHQRPKLERYGDTLFVVLRPARYLDAAEEVDFGELHVFLGPDFVLTVRHSEVPNLAVVRRRMEGDPELLRRGPEAVLYAILDAVVDGYAPVVAGLQNDIDEIETEVFGSDPKVSRLASTALTRSCNVIYGT
jgi:CorA-like Mg2+ transporter protein